MKMNYTAEARVELNAAHSRVESVAKEINKSEDPHEAFTLLWKLGQELTHKLEPFRIPD